MLFTPRIVETQRTLIRRSGLEQGATYQGNPCESTEATQKVQGAAVCFCGVFSALRSGWSVALRRANEVPRSMTRKNSKRWLVLACAIASLFGPPANGAQLEPETVAAFDRYIPSMRLKSGWRTIYVTAAS